MNFLGHQNTTFSLYISPKKLSLGLLERESKQRSREREIAREKERKRQPEGDCRREGQSRPQISRERGRETGGFEDGLNEGN